jgi:hypothetical protein
MMMGMRMKMLRNRLMKLSYRMYVYVDDDGDRLDESAHISKVLHLPSFLFCLYQHPNQMLHGASLSPGGTPIHRLGGRCLG